MPKDYAKTSTKSKKRGNAKSSKKAPTPTWMWFLAIVLIVAFIAGVIYSHKYKWHHTKQNLAKTKQTIEAKAKAVAPKFEFYSMLQNSDENSSSGPKTSAPKTTLTKKPVPVVRVASASLPASNYIIQIASFKNHEPADQLKAKLTLQGMEVDIKAPSKTDPWYRVIAGPYHDRNTAKQIQNQLASSDYKSLLKKAS